MNSLGEAEPPRGISRAHTLYTLAKQVRLVIMRHGGRAARTKNANSQYRLESLGVPIKLHALAMDNNTASVPFLLAMLGMSHKAWNNRCCENGGPTP